MKTSVELRSRLAGLHEQLAGTPKVDAESRQMLRTLLTDIERQLEHYVTGRYSSADRHGIA